MTWLFLKQQAAGIFGHLKDSVLSLLQMTPTPDLDPDLLSALSALMVAQGQEAILMKAIQGDFSVCLFLDFCCLSECLGWQSTAMSI